MRRSSAPFAAARGRRSCPGCVERAPSARALHGLLKIRAGHARLRQRRPLGYNLVVPQRELLEFERLAPAEQLARSREFLARMRTRRTVRDFSTEPVPFELIENAIHCAALAPSGANQQPWRFVVVSDPKVKRRIREAAEAEERRNYEQRFPGDWISALAPLGLDWHKEFLETAPYLIVVFRIDYGIEHEADGGERHVKHYYVTESVGIAVGLLITALHLSGLGLLTYTPAPMGFLRDILERPKNERPFLVVPVGYPAGGASVPEVGKKDLSEVMQVV
jgi:iodotyrosine deiodinase